MQWSIKKNFHFVLDLLAKCQIKKKVIKGIIAPKFGYVLLFEFDQSKNKAISWVWLLERLLLGAGKISQWLKPWLFFQRTQVWFPASVWWLTMVCDSQAMGSEALFWLLRAPGTHMMHRHIYIGKAPIHTKFFKKIKNHRNILFYKTPEEGSLSLFIFLCLSYSQWGFIK